MLLKNTYCWMIVGGLLTAPAHAGRLSLNGVPIDGLTDQRFENCTVVVDEYGDVDIQSQAYKANRREKAEVMAEQKPPLGAEPSEKYWLVTKNPKRGMVQYDVDLYINAKWIRKFFHEESRVVFDLTPHLKAGPNKLVFRATKKIGPGGRKATTADHFMRFLVGEGTRQSRKLVITKPLFRYQRTAAEMKNSREEYVLVVR